MKPFKSGKKNRGLKAFSTFPLADDFKKDPKTNTTEPSDRDVEEAKDWVDFNKK